ncbi:hypothetical protein KJ966_24570 [bacterium]|nr:hypothetical protein [bacterium]
MAITSLLPVDLEIGDFKFEKVLPISAIIELDQQKDEAEFKRDIVKIIVWFVDDRQFGNWQVWHTNKLKEEKFQEFLQLVRKNEIQTVTHVGLNAMGFNFGKIRRVEPQFSKSRITVAFDLEQYNSLEDKKKKREPVVLADASNTDDVIKAAEAKLNQAQQDQEKSNGILDTINNLLKKLYE